MSMRSPRILTRTRQSGVVLIITLIALVVMTMAAIALIRSVDTTNLIAGNMAFQQSATQSADRGVEAAIAWLTTQPTADLYNDIPGNGYSAIGAVSTNNPVAGQSWDAFWIQTLASRPPVSLSVDAAGNTVSYVIDRLCAAAGPVAGASCSSSSVVTTATGNAEEGGLIQINANSPAYYRITVRVAGPRQTVSYVQSVISF